MTVRRWNYLMRSMIVVLLVAVIGFTFVACGQNNSTPVKGVYYYDGEGENYQVTLSENFGFTLIANDEIRSGEYFYDGENMSLVFSKEEEASATLKNGVFKLTYNGATITMLQRVNYTVSFNTNGGSQVPAQTVLNGKTAFKPADPTRENSKFLGWYVDDAFTAAFNFDTQIITQDTNVYARWASKEAGQAEFTVSFDANYQGAPAIESQETFGGKIISLPNPGVRNGYEFAGWWVSSLNNGEQLSYQCNEDYVYTSNVTLYAMWIQEAAVKQPVVAVAGNNVSWTSSATSAEYVVSVTGPEGFVAINKTVQTTSMTVDFANAPAGTYEISVTAQTAQGTSAASVVYFVNKGLQQPATIAVVEPATLVYSEVANAEKYIITVDCGSEGHNHVHDNGLSTTFSFSDCEMKEGGIVFTVTAKAKGYADSVVTFVYNKVLPQVTSVNFDQASETITWAPVAEATNYQVTVTIGQNVYTFDNGTSNSFSVKTFAQGLMSVAIVPQTKGYNSPEAVVYNYNKTTVSTPSNFAVAGNVLSWGAIEGATYEVKVGATVYQTNDANFDVTTVAGLTAGSVYAVSVRAKAGSSVSVWSDAVEVAYQTLTTVSYHANYATWDAVVGATNYKVKVTGVEEFETTANYAKINFAQAGENTIAVSFYNGSKWSEWVETTVMVYSIEFDSRSSSNIDTIYAATGDVVEFATPVRTGYDFAGWFNAPGGASANAYKYASSFVYEKTTNTVVFASWAAMKVTVSFNFKGFESSNVDFGTTIVTFDQNYTLPVPAAPSTAYSFGGWFEDINCTTPITNIHGESLAPWNYYNAERTVYAKWYQLLSYSLLNDGTYRIKKGPDIHKVTEVTIPAEIDGIAVTQVAGFAFDKCYDLQVINIPDTIKYIDLLGKAFDKCNSLKAINIYHVEGNNEIAYKSENGVLMVYDKNESQKLELGYVPMTMQGKFEVPYGVEVLPTQIFAKSAITEITIPATVSEIQENAFFNCLNLTKVTFLPVQEGETASELYIAQNAFRGCKVLSEITLPARLGNIATTASGEINAFTGCATLANIYVEDGCANYKNPTDKSGVLMSTTGTLLYVPNATPAEFTIPSGVTAIGPYAFARAYCVTSVNVPAWVTTIGQYAFSGMSNLDSVTFESSVAAFGPVTIAAHAFDGCKYLTQVVFEEGTNVVEFGNYAFANCLNLAKIEIPSTVTTVGDKAFSGCSKAREAVIADSENALTFGTAVFENCTSLREVTIPARITAMPEGMFPGCSNLRDVSVDENNTVLKDIDGVLFTKDGKKLLFFSQVRGGEYEVPAGVEEIGAKVFQNNTALTGITFGADVKVIGDYAFDGCSGLTGKELTIGANVTYIGEYAFRNTKLLRVTFDQTGTEELVLGIGAFKSGISNTYTSLTSSYYFELVLPARLKVISDNAFESCAFPKVVFTDGNQIIGNYAFYKNTTLKGTTWNGSAGSLEFISSIQKVGNYAFSGCTGLKVLNLDEGAVAVWGTYVFNACTSLTSVTLPTTWTEIPEGFLYANAKSLKGSIVIAKTVEKIGYRAFYEALQAIESFSFEDGGTQPLVIGTKGYLSSVTKEWEDRGYYTSEAFYKLGASNTKLTSIDLPDRLTIIGNAAFNGAKNIQYFNVSENSNLANIGEQAFYGCSALKEFYVPSTVTNLPQVAGYTQQPAIGYRAFNSSKFTKITFEEGGTLPLTIANQAFYSCSSSSFTTLNLPGRMGIALASDGKTPSIIGLPTTFSNNNKFTTITIGDGTESAAECCLVAKDNIIYTSDLTQLVFAAAKSTATQITIPKQLTNIPASAFKSNTTLTKVIFEEGGTAPLTIGNEAFSGCSKITDATLPERVTSIGVNAFYNCKLMTRVYVPKSVTEIGAGAFKNCTAAPAPEFGTNDDGSVNFKKIGEGTFNVPTGTTEWTVPKGVEVLSVDFLYGGTGTITKLYFPDSVHTVNADNTSGKNLGSMMKLAEIVLNDTNSNFKFVNGALYTADGATLIMVVKGTGGSGKEYTVLEGTDTIGQYAFASTQFAKITIPNTVSKIDNYAFHMTTVPNFDFKDGDIPLVLGVGLFNANRSVTSLTLPARTISIDATFIDAPMLTSVTFAPNSRLQIVSNIFYSMYLTEFTFPKSVVSYEQTKSEYGNCSNLTKVIFEEGSQLQTWNHWGGFTTEKEEGAGAGPMQIVNFPFDTVTTYKAGSLANTNITKVKFAEGITTIPANLFGETNLVTEVTLPSTTQVISTGAFKGMQITEINLPEGVTEIGDSAFEGCTQLSQINWPNSLERIGERAFYGCTSLTSVTIGTNIKNHGIGAGNYEMLGIDTSAFENCENLTTVTVVEGGTEELSIGKFAFKNTPKLTSFYFPERLAEGVGHNSNDSGFIREGAFDGSGLTEVVLPYSLKCTYLAPNAFANCKDLTSVTLGYGVETVSENAFANCEKLTYAYLPASVITFDNAFFNCPSVVLDIDPGILDYTYINGVWYNVAETEVVYVTKDVAGEVVIPDTVKAIAPSAFKGLSAITGVKFSAAMTAIPEAAFEGTGITTLVVPANITSIGASAFKNCASLQSVTFDKSEKALQIGDYAFAGCTSLQAIQIPDRARATDKVHAIGNHAFEGDIALQSITFEPATYNVDYKMYKLSFGEYAFAGCTSLTTVTFPQRLADASQSGGLYAVDSFAFAGCTNLASVNFYTNEIGMPSYWAVYADWVSENGPTFTLGEGAFANTAITQLVIPAATNFYSPAQKGCYGIKYFNGAFGTYEVANPVSEGVAIVTIAGPNSTSVAAGTAKESINLYGCAIYYWIPGDAENSATINVTADMLGDIDTFNDTAEDKKVVVTGSYQGYNFAFELTIKPHTCTSVCATCNGCTDAECTFSACATKCPGHEVVEETPAA